MQIKFADILNSHVDTEMLPYIVQDISHLIGLHLTLKLVEHYKGTYMWVPKEYKPDHVLVKLVGHEPAIKLIKAYGGENVEIPKCLDALRFVRNAIIRQSDKSQAELAREHNLTIRQIRNITHGHDGVDDKQESLF